MIDAHANQPSAPVFLPTPAAFDALMKSQAGPLRRAAFAQVKNPAEAEDVLQETWLAAYRSWPRFRAEGSASSWLRSILRRKVIDHARKRRPTTDLDSVAEPAAPALHAEDRLDALTSLTRIHAATPTLKTRERLLLERCLLAGDPPTEVARELGASPVTIRVAVHRLRQSMHAMAA